MSNETTGKKPTPKPVTFGKIVERMRKELTAHEEIGRWIRTVADETIEPHSGRALIQFTPDVPPEISGLTEKFLYKRMKKYNELLGLAGGSRKLRVPSTSQKTVVVRIGEPPQRLPWTGSNMSNVSYSLVRRRGR